MASLQSLPYEIIFRICEELCFHCRAKLATSSVSQIQPDWQLNIARRALLSLANSCRRLHWVAQPILYHYISPDTPEAVSLLRSLSSNFNLRQHIKVLCIQFECDYGQAERLGRRGIEFLEQLIRDNSAGFDKSWLPANLAVLDAGESQYDDGRIGSFVLESLLRLQTVMIALLIAFSPSVESLFVQAPLQPLPTLGSNCLAKLTELSFSHNDPQGGTSTDYFRSIFMAAPRLDIIRGCMLSDANLIPHEAVRTLFLTKSGISRHGLETLMSSFPRLETFIYQSGGPLISYDEATPAEISVALLLRRDTLRNVEIRLHRDYEIEYFIDENEGDVYGSLKQMQVLQTLQVDAFAFCLPAQMDDYDGQGYLSYDNGPPRSDNILIDFLPTSIEKIIFVPPATHFQNALLRLAHRCKTIFPKLREIGVWNLEKDPQEELKTAFSTADVTVRGAPVNLELIDDSRWD